MTRRQFAQLLTGIGAYMTMPALARSQGQSRRMRIGLSEDTLAGANLNDARAAYTVWGQEIGRSLGIDRTEMLPEVFIPSAQLIQMIGEGTIDCFALTAWEYAKAIDSLDTDWVLIEDDKPEGVQYILAVHNASPFKKLEDLRGAQLTTLHHRDTVLLNAWLSLLLANAGQGPMERFFGNVVPRDNLTQVVLPVFFRRADAAGLTQRSFSVATEMNPQLARDLRVLAVSPTVIPTLFCFRRGCKAEDRQQFKDAVVKLKTVTAGQQVLQLYQSHGFNARPGSAMKETLEMVRQYERLQIHVGTAARKGHF